MKRIIALILLTSFLFLFTSCQARDDVQVSCEEILQAYRDAGYTVGYHNHNDPIYFENHEYCSIEIKDPSDPERNYLYITRYFTVEDAKDYEKQREFNPVLWLFFGVYGEWRWLKVRQYGDTVLETFDNKMLLPMESLVK